MNKRGNTVSLHLSAIFIVTGSNTLTRLSSSSLSSLNTIPSRYIYYSAWSRDPPNSKVSLEQISGPCYNTEHRISLRIMLALIHYSATMASVSHYIFLALRSDSLACNRDTNHGLAPQIPCRNIVRPTQPKTLNILIVFLIILIQLILYQNIIN